MTTPKSKSPQAHLLAATVPTDEYLDISCSSRYSLSLTHGGRYLAIYYIWSLYTVYISSLGTGQALTGGQYNMYTVQAEWAGKAQEYLK